MLFIFFPNMIRKVCSPGAGGIPPRFSVARTKAEEELPSSCWNCSPSKYFLAQMTVYGAWVKADGVPAMHTPQPAARPARRSRAVLPSEVCWPGRSSHGAAQRRDHRHKPSPARVPCPPYLILLVELCACLLLTPSVPAVIPQRSACPGCVGEAVGAM